MANPQSQFETSPEPSPEPLIRNVSDTARWVAVYRAEETERADAIFRDPFARRLAGERGEQIAKLMPLGGDNAWSIITLTYLIDEFIKAELQRGADMVINLAAGLDSQPVCLLERIRLDLSDLSARRELFARLGQTAKRALVITEGLMIYLTPEAAGGLAADFAAPATFRSWILDIASPGLLRMLRKRMASQLREAAPFKFAPQEGPAFFERYGWKPIEVQSLLKNAARLKRLSFVLRLFALLPENEKSRRDRPWSGVCLFANKKSS